MNLDASVHGDKAEDLVAKDGVAALGQRVVDTLQVAANDKFVVGRALALIVDAFEVELLGASGLCWSVEIQVEIARLLIFFEHVVDVEFLLGQLLVEVARLLETQFLDGVGQNTLREVELLVFQLALQHLLRQTAVLLLRLLQCEAYLRTGTRGLHNVQPLLTRLLRALREDFNGVARVQLLADGHYLSIHLSTHARVAYMRVDVVGKVENGGALRELQQVALGSEHKHFIVVEVELELVHHLQVVAGLEGGANVGEPLVESRLALHALVAPVGSKSALGNLVHALGANLHLHPLLFRSEHGDMQAFVAVRLRHA